MKKHVASTIKSFFEKYSLNSSAQFGFTKSKKAISLLEEFSYFVNSFIEKIHVVLALFLGLTRAFDTIDRKLMLKKFYALGF